MDMSGSTRNITIKGKLSQHMALELLMELTSHNDHLSGNRMPVPIYQMVYAICRYGSERL